MFNRDTGRRRRDPRCSQSVMVASLSIAAVPASSASDPAPPTADDVVEAASLSAASLMEATGVRSCDIVALTVGRVILV